MACRPTALKTNEGVFETQAALEMGLQQNFDDTVVLTWTHKPLQHRAGSRLVEFGIGP